MSGELELTHKEALCLAPRRRPDHGAGCGQMAHHARQNGIYGCPDLCAAFALRYRELCEGGADEWMNTIKRAYRFCGAEDRLLTN